MINIFINYQSIMGNRQIIKAFKSYGSSVIIEKLLNNGKSTLKFIVKMITKHDSPTPKRY